MNQVAVFPIRRPTHEIHLKQNGAPSCRSFSPAVSVRPAPGPRGPGPRPFRPAVAEVLRHKRLQAAGSEAAGRRYPQANARKGWETPAPASALIPSPSTAVPRGLAFRMPSLRVWMEHVGALLRLSEPHGFGATAHDACDGVFTQHSRRPPQAPCPLSWLFHGRSSPAGRQPQQARRREGAGQSASSRDGATGRSACVMTPGQG